MCVSKRVLVFMKLCWWRNASVCVSKRISVGVRVCVGVVAIGMCVGMGVFLPHFYIYVGNEHHLLIYPCIEFQM